MISTLRASSNVRPPVIRKAESGRVAGILDESWLLESGGKERGRVPHASSENVRWLSTFLRDYREALKPMEHAGTCLYQESIP